MLGLTCSLRIEQVKPSIVGWESSMFDNIRQLEELCRRFKRDSLFANNDIYKPFYWIHDSMEYLAI